MTTHTLDAMEAVRARSAALHAEVTRAEEAELARLHAVAKEEAFAEDVRVLSRHAPLFPLATSPLAIPAGDGNTTLYDVVDDVMCNWLVPSLDLISALCFALSHKRAYAWLTDAHRAHLRGYHNVLMAVCVRGGNLQPLWVIEWLHCDADEKTCFRRAARIRRMEVANENQDALDDLEPTNVLEVGHWQELYALHSQTDCLRCVYKHNAPLSMSAVLRAIVTRDAEQTRFIRFLCHLAHRTAPTHIMYGFYALLDERGATAMAATDLNALSRIFFKVCWPRLDIQQREQTWRAIAARAIIASNYTILASALGHRAPGSVLVCSPTKVGLFWKHLTLASVHMLHNYGLYKPLLLAILAAPHVCLGKWVQKVADQHDDCELVLCCLFLSVSVPDMDALTLRLVADFIVAGQTHCIRALTRLLRDSTWPCQDDAALRALNHEGVNNALDERKRAKRPRLY